jgi:hypothetical protein
MRFANQWGSRCSQESMPNFTLRILTRGYYFRYRLRVGAGVRDAFGALHVVLGSLGAAFGVFLVEGDAFGFAHEGELDVDAVEEFGGQETAVGAACDCKEFGPVLGDERGVVDAKAGIKEGAGVDEIAETYLLDAHGPWKAIEPLEEADGFVFVVEFVGSFGDGGSAEKIHGFLEAGFQGTFYVVGQGDAFFAGGYLSQRAKAFAQSEGEGLGSWDFGVPGFGLFWGFHGISPGR